MELLEQEIKASMEEALKTMKRTGVDGGNWKEWMTSEIEESVSLRRKYNRQKRWATGETLEHLTGLYEGQKLEASILIREAKTMHERQLTNDLKQSQWNKKIWDAINKLRDGKNIPRNQPNYGEDGQKLSDEENSRRTEAFWRGKYESSCV